MKNGSHNKEATRHRPVNGSGRFRSIICIFLAAATLVVYGQTVGHEFLNYDDDVYVTKNGYVQEGFSSKSVVWAFTTNHSANWHPVTWFSHMLDCQFFGLSPSGHHFTNVLIHIANAILLFLVLMRMTGKLWQSAFVAALFALHPLNVDSVAWVAERKNVLSAFFLLLTIWAYVGYAEKKTVYKYCLALLFFALGLMSKPMLVTLPFVLLMLDYWPLGRLKLDKEKGDADKGENISRLIREKIPFMALTIASCVVTFAAQKSGGSVQTEMFSLQARIVNGLVSYLEYLQKMVWPKGLSILYPHPGNLLPVWKGVVCAAILAGITVAAVRLLRRAPYFAFGWFWFLGTLVPVIGLVQVGVQAMADRYAYIPLIGIFIVVAWGAPDLAAKMRYRDKALSISAGVLISALIVVTWMQVSHWKNSVTILKHAVAVTDKEYSSFANIYNNLGSALNEQKEIDGAILNYRKALKLNSDHTYAHNNLGTALVELRKYEEAVPHFRAALNIEPDDAESHNHLGVALSGLRETEEAVVHYRKAIRLNPEFVLAHNHLGMALSEMGKFVEAAAHYREAIRLRPDYAEAHNNLGTSLGNMMKLKEAVAHYREALRLQPDYAPAQKNLGIVLSLLNKNDEVPDLF